jgi:hypothetical protein
MKLTSYQVAELWGQINVVCWRLERISKYTRDSKEFHKNLDMLLELKQRLREHEMSNVDIAEMLTNATVNFFEVEIRNEENGGISPSTLDSAWDSLAQAPDDVIIEWCDDDTVNDETGVKEFRDHIQFMHQKLGGDTLLDDLLPRG